MGNDIKFISAEEARKQTQDNIQKLDDPILLNIFEVGIYPAIEKGCYKCDVVSGDIIPMRVIEVLRRQGYTVNYGKSWDARNEEYENKHKLVISW